jgi:hypothetical protein
MDPRIYIAFRFHGNFYHSYRGDTPDELGFGKDIRIIRNIIKTLDALNQHGIPVCGTWDFENYFSLEKIMPAHCPDIIEAIQRRARDRYDEIQLMAYNNGLISAHTAREFEAVIQHGISNTQRSGLQDLFGNYFKGMVRPQEMMFTPIHLKLYKACGIDSISLYYSALPFNGFSNFVPQLSVRERYNPLTLTYPGIDETLTLLPCYNTGDLADHLTLRRWVKKMRQQQLAFEQPLDLLLLIDMDADDEFWVGFNIPFLKGRFSTASGLAGLVENVADLDYIRFTTPERYLKDHAPVETLTISQDTADGSFDGYSSWAEKHSNHRLWTGLERARILELQTRRLLGDEIPDTIATLLNESFNARLKLLSTTHFGMSAPVMNLSREKIACELTSHAVKTAAEAFRRSAIDTAPGTFSLLDYTRGVSTEQIQYQAHSSVTLVRLNLQENTPADFAISDSAGYSIPSAILKNGSHCELLFPETFAPTERKDYTIHVGQSAPKPQKSVVASSDKLQNEFLQLEFNASGQLTSLKQNMVEFTNGIFLTSAVTYDGRRYQVENWETVESLSLGVVGLLRMKGLVTFANKQQVRFERELLLASGLPYLYITMRVEYPRTPHKGFSKGLAQRLQQTWDARWQEVCPCEINPSLVGKSESPLRVWKHNYCDHISTFSLDYERFSTNAELDSVNNQITSAWTAVSDGEHGILVAQTADLLSGMAFCPLRTRKVEKSSRVVLNPFGSYWGRQYNYDTADTGLGKLLATVFSASDHIKPYAPSYNGQVQEFRLLVAPYIGDMPPQSVRNDAEAFAYPYLLLNDDQFIAHPPHHSWDGHGLGEISTQ